MHYVCRIHTNKYAGNFEREMAAYITGIAGEYIGDQEAAIAQKENDTKAINWFENNVLDDGDYEQIGRIVPTPGWSNNGNGKHFHNTDYPFPAYQSVEIAFDLEPPTNIKQLIEQRAESFACVTNMALEILGVEFYEIRTVERKL